MEKVKTIEQYEKLVADFKKKGHRIISNNYMFIDDIRRYINMKRLYYEELENGLVFYSDEETHYRCYFYIDSLRDMKISRKDKVLLTQILYRENRINKVQVLRDSLRESGFHLQDKMDYIVTEASTKMNKIERLVKYAEELLEENQLVFRSILPEELEQFREFQKNIKNIPFYQVPYYSAEEYMQAIKENRAQCIVDVKGSICAIHFFEYKNGNMLGWYAIEEEYQKAYGIALLFTYSTRQFAIQNHTRKIYGWVLKDNKESIKYHKKLGYIWQDRIMEEWLLDKI